MGPSHSPAHPIIDPIRNFVQLERVLAAILVLTPLLLLLVDDAPGGIRGSISSYHDVVAPEAFYVPLTVAAMLFVVNGVLKSGHWYNSALGTFLLVLLAFDHDGTSRDLHIVGAAGFFVGNVAVMALASRGKNLAQVLSLGTTVLAVVGLCVLTDWFTLFWAEWVSLTVIAAHYILDTIPARLVRYSALTKASPARPTSEVPSPSLGPVATGVAA